MRRGEVWRINASTTPRTVLVLSINEANDAYRVATAPSHRAIPFPPRPSARLGSRPPWAFPFHVKGRGERSAR